MSVLGLSHYCILEARDFSGVIGLLLDRNFTLDDTLDQNLDFRLWS